MAPTRMLLGAIATALLGASALTAQPPRLRVYSHPAPPADDALRRLNLTMQWRAYVPMDGRRDGIVRAELDGKDLFVLTRSGMVMRLDAETGTVHWKTRVGKPYTLVPFFAANRRGLGVIGGPVVGRFIRRGRPHPRCRAVVLVGGVRGATSVATGSTSATRTDCLPRWHASAPTDIFDSALGSVHRSDTSWLRMRSNEVEAADRKAVSSPATGVSTRTGSQICREPS